MGCKFFSSYGWCPKGIAPECSDSEFDCKAPVEEIPFDGSNDTTNAENSLRSFSDTDFIDVENAVANWE